MKPLKMGSETEYSVNGHHKTSRQVLSTHELYGLMEAAIRREFRWLPDARSNSGMYLEHGGRFYPDSGIHPEYATPEVSTPAEVTAYDKAGERILFRGAERVLREHQVEVSITKHNIGVVFPDRVTWGSHESYTCWDKLSEVAPQLIPHLVSRLAYAGSGCLSAHASGWGFELSQRARHLVQAMGNETTSNRAIFCTRIRKLSDASADGWTRAHLIGKDSHRSPLSIYLTFGTTGLLFAIINQGGKVGRGLELAEPVRALRTFSLDPWHEQRVPLVDGRKLTALEIQESYLEECELWIARVSLPDWAPDVIRHWRDTLQALLANPLSLADRLDTYLKLYVVQHELDRSGCTWSEFHRALMLLAQLRAEYNDPVMRALLNEGRQMLDEQYAAEYGAALAVVDRHGSGALERLRFVVRVQALDLKFHEIGGWYDQLALSGGVASLLNEADVARATTEPPPDGRAAIRGREIKEHHGEAGWVCDWRYVLHAPSRTCFDLRDPFEASAEPVQLGETWHGDPLTDAQETMARLRTVSV